MLARAGLNRKSALATVTMVLAAEAPDLDVVSQLHGSIAGFAHHRGFTHTFLGIPVVAALVVGAVYLGYRIVGRFRGRFRRDSSGPPPRWGVLFGLAVLAGLSHILLDFTNDYGVRPFAPFSYRWYSWDIVFIVEPVLLVILIAALLLPSLFRLVKQARSGSHVAMFPGRTAAVVALILVFALWGFRDYQHRRAVAALESLRYEAEPPRRVSAFPYWINPFRWYGVVETDNFYDRALVNSLTSAVDFKGRADIRYDAEAVPVVEAASRSYLGRVFLDWARYPVAEIERTDIARLDEEKPFRQASDVPNANSGEEYVVRFYDVRFQYPGSHRHILEGWVRLNANLNVIGQNFGPRRTAR